MKILLPLLLPFFASGLMAQNAAPFEPPPRQLRVLDSLEVDFGNRSIFYNRIETPVLRQRPAPLPAPVETSDSPTPEDLARIREWESKSDVMLFLSATVFDREITLVRWRCADGDYVLWSSIDFNHLRSLMTFETVERRYTLFLGIGEETTKKVGQEPDPQKAGGPLPPRRLAEAAPARSAFQFVSVPKTGVSPAARRALDDLHRYYNIHRARLSAGFEASEAARAAHEKWVKENLPIPKDTTISYFPIRSDLTDRETPTPR